MACAATCFAAGVSWQKIESGAPVSIGAGAEFDDGMLVLLTQTGQLLTSRDDGRGFTGTGLGAPVPATGLAASADGHIAIASLRGMRRVAVP
jgi:hypothetical protein